MSGMSGVLQKQIFLPSLCLRQYLFQLHEGSLLECTVGCWSCSIIGPAFLGSWDPNNAVSQYCFWSLLKLWSRSCMESQETPRNCCAFVYFYYRISILTFPQWAANNVQCPQVLIKEGETKYGFLKICLKLPNTVRVERSPLASHNQINLREHLTVASNNTSL